MSKRKAVDQCSEKSGKRQASISGFFENSSSAQSSRTPSATSESRHKIYCDLDGVLVDFEAGVRKLFQGKGPDDIRSSAMWSAISKSNNFYFNLPWTKDGKDLWNAIRHLSPDILTGVPMAKKAREEKARWCQRELGMKTNHVDMAGTKQAHLVVAGRKSQSVDVVNVITCWSRNKHFESGTNSVLIDDRFELSKDWTSRGGIFIHHTDAKSTLQKLREKGILTPPTDPVVEEVDNSDDEVQIVSESKEN